jgi:vitamin B12 transporter
VVSDNRFSDDWQSKVQLSQGIDDTQNYLNGVPDVALGSEFKTTSDLYSWQNNFHIGEKSTLAVGLEKLKQQVATDTLYTRSNRTDDSLFLGYTGNRGDKQVQLNLRSDKYSDFGTAKTWLLGFGLDLTEVWRITASMATAFKAPTLNDMFYPFTDFGTYFGVAYSYVGNPNLKPERSRNNEVGLHFANEGRRLDVAVFDNRIRDLIVNNNLSAGSMVNLDEARINGIELGYNAQYGDTGVKLAATQQNPRDAQTGKTLLRRAKSFYSVGIAQQINALKVGCEWQHSGVRLDRDINTAADTILAAYDVVNLTASYALDKHFDLSARVDNLQNRDYMLAHGYNTLGRTWFIGLSYR